VLLVQIRSTHCPLSLPHCSPVRLPSPGEGKNFHVGMVFKMSL
jgi:hypothetical protein